MARSKNSFRSMVVNAIASARRMVRGKFDSAQTTPENSRHWANADSFSANAALMPQVRKTLRERSRYETANNSYAKGIVLTLANDVVGTGPRLQMRTGIEETNIAIEKAFENWAIEIGLAEKLRTMRQSRAESGECFAMLVNNPKLKSPVKLDIRLIEADQVADLMQPLTTPYRIDGIEYDEFWNPKTYFILRQHPGSLQFLPIESDPIPAKSVLHYFRADRPGQGRGIPDLTPALPLFAQLRRYTLAVLTAAETAADFAGTLETDAPSDGADAADPFDAVPIERNSIVTLPMGWKLSQMKAEQPVNTYAEFKREIINEIARCLNMPFNIAAGNSSSYNYASGRLDHQTYYKAIKVDQQHLEDVVINPILAAWLEEAILILDFIPARARKAVMSMTHEWFWIGSEHVDPEKEAIAARVRLETNTTTLAAEFAKQGKDWKKEIEQRGKEFDLMNLLKIPTSSPMPIPSPRAPEPNA